MENLIIRRVSKRLIEPRVTICTCIKNADIGSFHVSEGSWGNSLCFKGRSITFVTQSATTYLLIKGRLQAANSSLTTTATIKFQKLTIVGTKGTKVAYTVFGNKQYRYAFNGMERDDDIKGSGNWYQFGDFGYDPRIGRRNNTDPVVKLWESPYTTFGGNPIYYSDPTGYNKEDRIAKRGAKEFANQTGGKLTKNGKGDYTVDVSETNWYKERQQRLQAAADNAPKEQEDLSQPEMLKETVVSPFLYEFKSNNIEQIRNNLLLTKLGGVSISILMHDLWDVDSWGDRMWLWKERTKFAGVNAGVSVSETRKNQKGLMSSLGLSISITGQEIGIYQTTGVGIAGSGGPGASAFVGIIRSDKKRSNNTSYEGVDSRDLSGWGVQGDVSGIPSPVGYIGSGIGIGNKSIKSFEPANYHNPQLSTSTSRGISLQKTYTKTLFRLHISQF